MSKESRRKRARTQQQPAGRLPDVEIAEEDLQFVSNHSTLRLAESNIAEESGRKMGKQKQSRSLPPQLSELLPNNAMARHKRCRDEDDYLHLAEERQARRQAATQGWQTKQRVLSKERLPIKTINGKLHTQFVEEAVQESASETSSDAERHAHPAAEAHEQGQDSLESEQEASDEEAVIETSGEEEDEEGSVEVYDSADDAMQFPLRAQNPQTSGHMVTQAAVLKTASSLTTEAFGGDFKALQRARLELRKVEMATLCEDILEDPEAGLTGAGRGKGGSKVEKLLGLLQDDEKKVQALAMLSLLAIFRDIIPAYRIRVLTEREIATKVSKEVKQTREYERILLSMFQRYLKHLQQTCKTAVGNKKRSSRTSDASLAIHCLIDLLLAHPHFNFVPTILTCLIHTSLSSSLDPKLSLQISTSISRLLEKDMQGEVSLTVTKLISKAIQGSSFRGGADLLKALGGLRLRVKEDEAEEAILRGGGGGQKKGKKKRDQGFGETEGQRDGVSDEVLAGLKEAEARADPVLRARYQAETLQEVTLLHFRILKHPTPHSTLLPACLAGLAHIAHLINLDTVIDLIHTLKTLLDPCRHLPVLSSLHAVLTALRILQGPGRELKVDDKGFLTYLYQQIPRLANRHGQQHLSTLETCLRAALIERREYSVARVAAFYKRLLLLALHLSAREASFVVRLVKDLSIRYPELEQMLGSDADRVAAGIYRPDCPDPEGSDPLATAAWEAALLCNSHFHPAIQRAAAAVLSGSSPEQQIERRGVVSEPLEIEKVGFGGIFGLSLPRANPLHHMVKKAQVDRKGHRCKLYFLQKIGEGGGGLGIADVEWLRRAEQGDQVELEGGLRLFLRERRREILLRELKDLRIVQRFRRKYLAARRE